MTVKLQISNLAGNYLCAVTELVQKFHTCLIYLLTKSAAIRHTSTWERSLFALCLLLSKFLLLYISCSTSRNCTFFNELFCLESYKENDPKKGIVFNLEEQIETAFVICDVVRAFFWPVIYRDIPRSSSFSVLPFPSCSKHIKHKLRQKITHLSTYEASCAHCFADSHFAAILRRERDMLSKVNKFLH